MTRLSWEEATSLSAKPAIFPLLWNAANWFVNLGENKPINHVTCAGGRAPVPRLCECACMGGWVPIKEEIGERRVPIKEEIGKRSILVIAQL